MGKFEKNEDAWGDKEALARETRKKEIENRQDKNQRKYDREYGKEKEKGQTIREAAYKEDEVGAVGILRKVYDRISNHQSIENSKTSEEPKVPSSVEEELAKLRTHETTRADAFKDIYVKLERAFDGKLKNKIDTSLSYTHDQGFIVKFEQGRSTCKIKLGDRLDSAEHILANAETALNLASEDACKIVGGKKGRFGDKTEMASWIRGEREILSFERETFKFLLPREEPSLDVIMTYPDESKLLPDVRKAAKYFLTTIQGGKEYGDFRYSKRQVALLKEDIQRLRWDPKVIESQRDIRALEDILLLCKYMEDNVSFRQKARELEMTKHFDVPKSADIYDKNDKNMQVNERHPISALEAEKGLAQMRAVFGTEKNPKIVGPYRTYLKYVHHRGPRVICEPNTTVTLDPICQPRFAINLGHSSLGLKHWLRNTDLVYNALKRDGQGDDKKEGGFYIKRSAIFKREFEGLLKLVSPKVAWKKLFGVKENEERGTKEESGIYQNIKKTFKKRPLQSLVTSPFILFSTCLSLATHHIPLYCLQVFDRAAGMLCSPIAKAEVNSESMIWQLVSTAYLGMGLIQVENIDFRNIENMGNRAFDKTEMKNSRFIKCGLSGTSWTFSQLNNVSFKMYGGLTGVVERIPILNLILWPPSTSRIRSSFGKADHRVQARSMNMMGAEIRGFFSFANRADMRETNFERSFHIGFTMRGAWLNGIKTDEDTRWGFMFPPGYELIRRIPIVGSYVILPVFRALAFSYFCEDCFRGEGDNWQGVGNPQRVTGIMFGKTEWGSQWSLVDYFDFVAILKKSAAFQKSIRTRIPSFLEEQVAGLDDFVVVDMEGLPIKLLVTWDGGANNRVIAFYDHPDFVEEASKEVVSIYKLNRALTVGRNDKWDVPFWERTFSSVAKGDKGNMFGDTSLMPDLIQRLEPRLSNLTEEEKFRAEQDRIARARNHNQYGAAAA